MLTRRQFLIYEAEEFQEKARDARRRAEKYCHVCGDNRIRIEGLYCSHDCENKLVSRMISNIHNKHFDNSLCIVCGVKPHVSGLNNHEWCSGVCKAVCIKVRGTFPGKPPFPVTPFPVTQDAEGHKKKKIRRRHKRRMPQTNGQAEKET